ncbi:MAG: FHA domain-containing protein [Eubacterium sp.]|nr:FHA domain-containing protein [Eubacterium sp.]
MSILSQAGMILLIICIIPVLIRSNRQLSEAASEGEHFVDEWALKEMRRQELLQEEAARREERLQLEKAKREIRLKEEQARREKRIKQEEALPELPDNIVPIYREPEVRLALVELDERRNPVRKIQVRRLPFTIGRDADNDLVIDNLTVARKHCRITSRNQAIVMEDSGSRNKLAVGGAMTSETVLSDRMSIGIGDREYLVEMGV